MLRRYFLQLAASCIILPALRWVPATMVEVEWGIDPNAAGQWHHWVATYNPHGHTEWRQLS